MLLAEGYVEFIFSKNGGLKESLSKQLRYGGSYTDFAKALINLDRVLDSAILIDVHGDKYKGTSRANENLEAVYVLLGAFQDGSTIIPVQMEIKKSSDVGGRLYMTVALTKIEADVLGSAPETIQTRSLISASNYSLADIVREINPEDAHFLKYLPDDMLSPAQVAAKNRALSEDAKGLKGIAKRKLTAIIQARSTAATWWQRRSWWIKRQRRRDIPLRRTMVRMRKLSMCLTREESANRLA